MPRSRSRSIDAPHLNGERGSMNIATHSIGLSCGIAAVLAAAAWPGTAATAPDPAIHPYSAVYQIDYKGKDVGTVEFSVNYDAANDVYRFSSNSAARGIFRLFSPRPVVERSEFTAKAGKITPLEFWFEDGSRQGNENFHIRFDWDNELAVAETKERRHEFVVPRDTLDRGTMQIQFMLDVASTGSLGSYTLADEDGLRTYEYHPDGNARLETHLGALATQAFIQQRAGSSRQTLLWTANELHHLPVRIEQKRNGETRTVFVLESVTWLDDH